MIGQDIYGSYYSESFASEDNISINSSGDIIAISDPHTSQFDNGDYIFEGNGSTIGLVKVFTLQNNNWVQMGDDIYPSNSNFHRFGYSISLNDEGNRIAIGAPYSDVNGISNSGLIQVYEFSNESWNQIGQNIYGVTGSEIGSGVKLNGEGNKLVYTSSVTTSEPYTLGGVSVVSYNGDNWSQIGETIIPESSQENNTILIYPDCISIDNEGNTVALILSGSFGYNGVVKIYENIENNWVQVGNSIAGEPSPYFSFTPTSVSISGDGITVAVGSDVGGNNEEYTFVYEWDETSWTQKGEFIVGEQSTSGFGSSISITDDGDIIAVGAPDNFGIAPQATGSIGSVRCYEYINNQWTQLGSDLDGIYSYDYFGKSVRLNSSGTRLLVASPEYHPTDSIFGRVSVINLEAPCPN